MGSTILISSIWFGHQRNGSTLDRPQAQTNMAITTCFLLLDKKLNRPSDATVKMQSWNKAPSKHFFMDKKKNTKYAHQQCKLNSRDARLPAQTTIYPTKPFESSFEKLPCKVFLQIAEKTGIITGLYSWVGKSQSSLFNFFRSMWVSQQDFASQ